MTGQHAAHGPVANYLWMVSPWGPWAHAYRELGEVTAEALCTHSSSRSGLKEDDGTADRCPGCLVVIGKELANRLGDRQPLD